MSLPTYLLHNNINIKKPIDRKKQPYFVSPLYNNFFKKPEPEETPLTKYDDIIQLKHPKRIDKNIQQAIDQYNKSRKSQSPSPGKSTRRSRSQSPGKPRRRATISDVVEYTSISPRQPKSISPTESYRKCNDVNNRLRDGSIIFPCRIHKSVFHTKQEWDEYMELRSAKTEATAKFLEENRDPNYKRPHTTKSNRKRTGNKNGRKS